MSDWIIYPWPTNLQILRAREISVDGMQSMDGTIRFPRDWGLRVFGPVKARSGKSQANMG